MKGELSDISNSYLLDELEERLSNNGVDHQDDRANLFFHEVCEILENDSNG